MEKRRIRLEINGVVCGLITQETEEYMESLAAEVGDMMKAVLDASPFITREAAALTAALSYCDDAKKNGKKAFDLQERVDELEVEAELWQEEKAQMSSSHVEDGETKEKLSRLEERAAQLEARNTQLEETAARTRELEEHAARLEDENNALREALKTLESQTEKKTGSEPEEKAPEQAKPAAHHVGRGKNPLRPEEGFQQEGFVSFFEKK